MFVAHGGVFAKVEMQVKKWVEKKQQEEVTVKPVTKKMLAEVYHWDESCS